MIEERALVMSVNNDNPEVPLAYLEIERRSACGLCGQTRGCGNRVWGKLLAHQQAGFLASNTFGAHIGQHVVVAVDERAVMYAALLLYMLPLVTMLGTAAILFWMFASDQAAMVGAVLGLLAAWWWVKGFLSVRPHGFSRPQVVRLADENDCVIFQKN